VVGADGWAHPVAATSRKHTITAKRTLCPARADPLERKVGFLPMQQLPLLISLFHMG
jgi:hypothetical protein